YSTCLAGTFVAEAGSPSRDVTCSPCQEGSFSSHPDAPECTPHDGCNALGYRLGVAGTATSDAQCVVYEWAVRLGVDAESGLTSANGVAVSSSGEIYVTGATEEDFNGQERDDRSNESDVFVMKLNEEGEHV